MKNIKLFENFKAKVVSPAVIFSADDCELVDNKRFTDEFEIHSLNTIPEEYKKYIKKEDVDVYFNDDDFNSITIYLTYDSIKKDNYWKWDLAFEVDDVDVKKNINFIYGFIQASFNLIGEVNIPGPGGKKLDYYKYVYNMVNDID